VARFVSYHPVTVTSTVEACFCFLLFLQWWNQLSRFQRSVVYMLILAACLTALYFLPGTHPIWTPNNGKLNSALDKDRITPSLSLFPPKKVLLLLYSRT
jgi:hypothetical protein